METGSRKIGSQMSHLRESIVEYLEQLANELDTTELWLTAGDNESNSSCYLKISEIGVEPTVVTEQLLPERPESARPEGRDRLFSADREDGAFDVMAQLQQDIYERATDAHRKVKKRWNSVFANERLLVVRGEPGGGKTFLSKRTAIELFTENSTSLRHFESNEEMATLPIWITADKLAERWTLTQKKEQIIEFLLDIIRGDAESEYGEGFADWARDRLTSEFKSPNSASAVLFVDALDEIQSSNSDAFREVVGKLRKFRGQIVFTCRTMSWVPHDLAGLHPKKLTIVTLAPFDKRQQRGVIEKFFAGDTEQLTSLNRIASANYALQHSFQQPLFLTFGCLLHRQNELDTNTNLIDLYIKVTAKLIAGEFAPPERRPIWEKEQPGIVEKLEELFDEVGWQLFSANPESKSFAANQWDVAFRKAIAVLRKRYARTSPKTIERIIDQFGDSWQFHNELLKVRLIIQTGQAGSLQWSYLHKSLLEFSAGRALSRKPNFLAIVQPRFGDRYWMETLRFLAGLLSSSDLLKLIAEFRKEPNDIFGWKILVESRWIGISKSISEAEIEHTCFLIVSGLFECFPNRLGPILFSPLRVHPPERGGGLLKGITVYKPYLTIAFHSIITNRQCVRYIERLLVIPLTELISGGLQWVPDELIAGPGVNHYRIRASAMDAVQELQWPNPMLVETLLRVADTDDDDEAAGHAAVTLGRIGPVTDEIVAALLRMADSKSLTRRYGGVVALGLLGSDNEKVISKLITKLDDREVNLFAASSLALVAEHSTFRNRAVSSLLGCSWQSDPDLRAEVCRSLGKISVTGDEVGAFLIERLGDDDFFVQRAACSALGEIRAEAGIIPLSLFLRARMPEDVGAEAARALGAIGVSFGGAAEVLLEALLWGSPPTRSAAAEALVNLNPVKEQVVEGLRAAMFEPSGPQPNAIRGFGKIGKVDNQIVSKLITLANADVSLAGFCAQVLYAQRGDDPQVISFLNGKLGSFSFLPETALSILLLSKNRPGDGDGDGFVAGLRGHVLSHIARHLSTRRKDFVIPSGDFAYRGWTAINDRSDTKHILTWRDIDSIQFSSLRNTQISMVPHNADDLSGE